MDLSVNSGIAPGEIMNLPVDFRGITDITKTQLQIPIHPVNRQGQIITVRKMKNNRVDQRQVNRLTQQFIFHLVTPP